MLLMTGITSLGNDCLGRWFVDFEGPITSRANRRSKLLSFPTTNGRLIVEAPAAVRTSTEVSSSGDATTSPPTTKQQTTHHNRAPTATWPSPFRPSHASRIPCRVLSQLSTPRRTPPAHHLIWYRYSPVSDGHRTPTGPAKHGGHHMPSASASSGQPNEQGSPGSAFGARSRNRTGS